MERGTMILRLSLAILWLFAIVKNLLFHTYLWQLKEYRLDRLIPHLRLKTSRRMIFSPLSLAKWVLILLFLLTPTDLRVWLVYFVAAVFLIDSYFFFRQGLTRELFRPKFTLRMVEIILGSLLLLSLGLFLFQKDLWFFSFILLITERLIFLVVSFWILLTKAPVFLSKRKKIKRAEEWLKQTPQLKVIGVTGSYGKTSTKDFIAQVLAQKYKVAKTQGTNNTKIGVAQNILRELKKDTEIFVVEMGAYKKGEIADICRLIRPDIAVVTGINEQHLAIFGSLEKLIEAKYEIVAALPQEGIAVFNGDNSHCLKMAKKASKKFKTFLYQTKKPKKLSVSLAPHKIGNLLAAVTIAEQLGLTKIQIKKALQQLQPSDRTMKPIRGVDNIALIDDTYSSNPHGFLAALDYLKRLKAKNKVVITPGIIELGQASSRVHQQLGRAMQEGIDLIILTNDNFLEDIKKGVSKKTPLMVETSSQEVVRALLEQPPETVVLLEGRLPVKVAKALKRK